MRTVFRPPFRTVFRNVFRAPLGRHPLEVASVADRRLERRGVVSKVPQVEGG